MVVRLYTTLGCHLCEEALQMLVNLIASRQDIRVEEIEIADTESLMEKYGVRIPVIAIDQEELGWPFTTDELKTLIDNRTTNQ